MAMVQQFYLEGLILQRDTPITGELEGSVVGMEKFLRELVELTGQIDWSHSVQVLELQFGEILTRTLISETEEGQHLLITAMLPKPEQLNYHPLSPTQMAELADFPCHDEYLWHADEGCHIVVRKILIKDLHDERSVLDAILNMADDTAMWFEKIQNANSRPR